MKEKIFNIITLDIETYVNEQDNMQLYCICLYDGNNKISYHILDYLNINDMLRDLFDSLLI
jgi:hypothetical protein